MVDGVVSKEVEEIRAIFNCVPSGSAALEADFKNVTFQHATKGTRTGDKLIETLLLVREDCNLKSNIDLVLDLWFKKGNSDV